MTVDLDNRQRQAASDAAQDGARPSQEFALEEPYASLYYTESWVSVVKLLHSRIGLSQAEIARGAGVSQATVTRWLDREEAAPVRAYNRLDDLRYVVLVLLNLGMTPRLITFWLAAKEIHIGTDPLTAIAEGRFEEVIAVAKAFAQGRPPAHA
jgi:hypothetical protein